MFDLLLRGAHVVDPLNGINQVADVAIATRLRRLALRLTSLLTKRWISRATCSNLASSTATCIWALCGVLPLVPECSP